MIIFRMNINDLKGFIDLGGVFILAFVLLNVWGARLDHIEDKITRLMALVALLVRQNGKSDVVDSLLNDKELEVVKKLQ